MTEISVISCLSIHSQKNIAIYYLIHYLIRLIDFNDNLINRFLNNVKHI